MMRIAINGFGRIGRNFLRALYADKKAQEQIEVVAINGGPASPEMMAHLFKYDSIIGTYAGDVNLQGSTLSIDTHTITLVSECDIETLPWKDSNIDWVVECSGRATKRAQAQKHIDQGARNVLISAPAQDEDVTIIPGVNDELFDKSNHHIVALGSCTTNALVPTLKVLHDAYTIQTGFMTTIHAYTNTQVLLDVECSDMRRSRAAALNIIPTTTGAMKVLDKVMPELKGLFSGIAVRVPVAKVSLIDVVCMVEKQVTAQEVNALFTTVSFESMNGIIGVSDEQLVSVDFCCDDRSVIIDTPLTQVQKNSVKLFGWYDNEWAYSVRMKDFLCSI